MTTIALSIIILICVIYPCILAAGIRAGWLLRGVAVGIWTLGTAIAAFEGHIGRAIKRGATYAAATARREWAEGMQAVTR